MIYVYRWRNNEKRATLYQRRCIVLARSLRFNSCIVQFDDGQIECVSRNALRRAG